MCPRPAIVITSAFLTLVAALVLTSCDQGGKPISPSEPNSPTDSLRLAVSIPPQAELIRRIAGNHISEDPVHITVFVGTGQDPHHFSATPKQIMDLGTASAYFTIGMPFENALVEKLGATIPGLRIYNMAEGLGVVEEIDHGNERDQSDHAHAHGHGDSEKEESTESEEAHQHDHHGHDHSYDPHVWLSPPLLAEVARNIRDALTDLNPANATLYSKNLEAFEREIETLDEELAFTLEPCRGSAFFVYHPAFTHFAARYGLEQKAIEFEGKSPTPKQLMSVVHEARQSGASVIFTQPQFDPASAQTVADAIGGTVKSIDPLAKDILANLREISLTLYQATLPEASK